MKKIIIVLLFSLFIYSHAYSLGFQSLTSGTNRSLVGIYFPSVDIGYAVGAYGTIIKTTNTGLNWFELNSNTSSHLNSIFFPNNSTGYAVGYNGVILKTTNAGINWIANYVGTAALYSVYFTDINTGYAVGNSSVCMKTTNGGANWVYQTVPATIGVFTSVVFNNNKGYIGSVYGSNLFVTTNGGDNWLDTKSRSGDISTGGIAFSGSFGVMVGHESFTTADKNPLIFITNNNGSNWTEIALPNTKAMLKSVCICQTNPSLVFAVGTYVNDPTFGNKGYILHSTNAGVNWTEESWNIDPMIFYNVFIIGPSVYVVGDGGTILKSPIPVGITPIGNIVPEKYVLSQNYPNPFNPTTNIEFTIPKNGNVNLTVFDISGKVVTTLVNNLRLNAGKYKVDFNASNLSSGTYFYRLTAENFVATKKMVLVK